jgi:hypothetical protein
VGRGCEAQLGAGKGDELRPGDFGRGGGDDVEGGPEALGKEDDGAGVIFVVVAVVVDVFVRFWGRGEDDQRDHQGGGTGREEAAEGGGEW